MAAKQSKARKVAELVMHVLDQHARDLSAEEYAGAVSLIESDIDARKDALRDEHADEEGWFDINYMGAS